MKETEINEPISWLEWFLLLESAPKINLSAKQALFKTFDTSKSTEQTKADLLKNQDTVFMFKQNFGKNKLNTFHHLSCTGGNFYEKQEHFGAIQGIGEDVTSVVTPDMSQLLKLSAVATPVPSIEDYMKVETIDECKNLKIEINSYYSARNFIPIPPFMLFDLNQAISEHEGDSYEILLAAIKVIKEFDTHIESSEDLDTTETATSSCEDILHWLFLATRGKINSIPTVACSVRDVRKHFINVERMVGFGKTQDQAPKQVDISSSIQKPLDIIAASSSSTQDFLSKLTQIQLTNQDKTSNSFGKLSEKIQQMMLIASSRGSVVPSELNEEAQKFFKMQNFSKAQQYLESHLEAKGIECAIPTAVANLWLQGCLLWTNPLTPSGFAASVISSKDIIFNDSVHEGILLDFSTKHEISKNSLTKLTKTQVMYPSSIELMIERIEAILAFTILFFTERSYLSKGLNYLLTLCKSNRTLLRTKFYLDKTFIAKFIFLIDDRINKWLIECARANTVDETSLELVDFATIIMDLKLNRFFCDLPDSIKTIAKNDTSTPSNIEQTFIGKKRKQSEGKMTKIIPNDNVEDKWKLKDTETWQMWRHKTGNGPMLSCHAKPCLKFHVKGTCYEDCANKASHKKLTGDDFRKTDDFIKQVRSSFE